MERILGTFAIVSHDANHGKSLCENLLHVCLKNKFYIDFRSYTSPDELKNVDELTQFTHILITDGGLALALQLREQFPGAVVLFVPLENSEAVEAYDHAGVCCYALPETKEDYVSIIKMIYGLRSRFIPKNCGIDIQSV